MAAFIPSLWKGFAAHYIAYSIDKFGIQGAFGKVPKIGHATVFFHVYRFIGWRVIKEYENEAISKEKSIILTTELIAFKILLPLPCLLRVISRRYDSSFFYPPSIKSLWRCAYRWGV